MDPTGILTPLVSEMGALNKSIVSYISGKEAPIAELAYEFHDGAIVAIESEEQWERCAIKTETRKGLNRAWGESPSERSRWIEVSFLGTRRFRTKITGGAREGFFAIGSQGIE